MALMTRTRFRLVKAPSGPDHLDGLLVPNGTTVRTDSGVRIDGLDYWSL